MTAKQMRFMDEYVKDCNATQAAIRAGYSTKTAYSIGQENLNKPEISAKIQSRLQLLASESNVNAVWIRARLKENLERSMQARPVIDAEGNATGEYRYNGTVANKCLELLGRDLGMFGHRLEISLAPEVQSLIKDLALLAVTYCEASKRVEFISSLLEIEMRYLGKMPVEDIFNPIKDQFSDEIISKVLGISIESIPDRDLVQRTAQLIAKATASP